MEFDPEKITFFAKTDARGQNIPFGIKAKDRSKHVYVIGKTGMGKSTMLENMAVQDIKNGEGFAFIDPHGATAETLLDYIPEERKEDVLYFAPFDMEHPVSFNVMEDVGADKRHLVVSGLMSVFEKIWVDAWSARMAYILQNTLMALLEYPDATLLGVNRVLSDKNYRKKVVDNISDPSVKAFWVDEFAKYNERYMQEAGDAIKNKIGQFTANPLIRNIIGQPKSSFDIRQIMDEKKIMIMNLSKGLVGESNANLLGSMLTTRIYLAAMSRADLSQAEMRAAPQFYFYVDEFQSFANATFADILSEARKYKLNLTIAHQYIEQMEEEVRNAVFGNVGTIISFRVGPFDAEVLETIYAPQFYAVDICNLGFAQIYLTLMIDGIGSQPFSAVTLPPIEPASTSCKDIILHTSRSLYAKPRAEVEEAILGWHEQQHASESGNGGSKPLAVKRPGFNGQNGQRPERRSERRPERQSDGQSNNGDRVRSNGDRKSEAPRREERRTGSARREGSAEHNGSRQRNGGSAKEKGLDELRAVLAGLSSKEVQKEKLAEKKDLKSESRSEQKSTPRPRRESEPTKEKPKAENNNLEAKRDKPVEDSAEVLKDTLSKILDNTKSTNQRPQVKTQETTENKPPSRLDTQNQNRQPKPGIKPEPKAESKNDAATEPPATPQSSPTQVADRQPSTGGAIDPKMIERMMRVKSDDKTPLK